jgi:hypothetical protein
MPRRNHGPHLTYLEKCGSFYITWTEGGRSRQRSTGSKDRGEAERALAEFILDRTRQNGPSDPAQTLITEVLADFAEACADKLSARRLGQAIGALSRFWYGRMVADVYESTCRQYAKRRGVGAGTVRYELGILRLQSIMRSRPTGWRAALPYGSRTGPSLATSGLPAQRSPGF